MFNSYNNDLWVIILIVLIAVVGMIVIHAMTGLDPMAILLLGAIVWLWARDS